MKKLFLIYALLLSVCVFGAEPMDSLRQVAVPSEEFVRIPASYILHKLENYARQSGLPALASFSVECQLEGVESQRASFNMEGMNLLQAIDAAAEAVGAGVEYIDGGAVLKNPAAVVVREPEPVKAPERVAVDGSEYYGKYRQGYEQRMAEARNANAVSHLTKLYDGALRKIYDELVMSGNVVGALAVKAERDRIRTLSAVVASGTFGPKPAPKMRVMEKKPPVVKPQASTDSIIKLFGIKQTCTRPVFLLMAGPAMVADRDQPGFGRMKFHVIRNRLLDVVGGLSEGSQFNASLFWAANTSPFDAEMQPATERHKALFAEWLAPVNPLKSNDIYGTGLQALNMKLSNLPWPKRLKATVPSGGPKWLYDYKPSKSVAACYTGKSRGFMHWAEALCFAMEQRADAIFVITSNYVVSREDSPDDLRDSLREAAKQIYGPDKKKYPTVNVIVISNNSASTLGKFKSVLKVFDGEVVAVDDVKKYMIRDEKKLLDSL
ncbi:hypothetical protein [Pontiella sulfatireligans]|uniref:Uncharacterized protein n=1 Tax=Pontiella sulfatireligans TaxID=2750658 RepID=A0A6C2UGI4_9BACT|nr:hypothetical protein [Pontiella sulfatireligans]VGO19285.1 hypothetical protein SCARR_01343 [Pontiella sulfatireligans]